jgi:colanic acid/amylovoran biosynthesis glycosyltransferase
MGIDGNSFKFHPKISIKNKKVINVLSIARLIEKKGLEFSIKAIAKTLKTFSNIKYTIIGDGLLRSNLQNLLKKLNVEDKIDIVGWKNRKEVIGALENTDIFLAPSVTASNGDMEGIPVVLMEAMAIGIPVISTMHSGIPELIKNRETGFIVPERDIDAISKIIEKMLINKFDLSTITKNARTLVEKKFNVNKQVDELVELYKNLTKLKE